MIRDAEVTFRGLVEDSGSFLIHTLAARHRKFNGEDLWGSPDVLHTSLCLCLAPGFLFPPPAVTGSPPPPLPELLAYFRSPLHILSEALPFLIPSLPDLRLAQLIILLPLLFLIPSCLCSFPALPVSVPLLIPPPLLEFFREMLSISQHSLAQLFSHSYGRLYSQHAVIFNSLFSGLRDYYEKSGEGLDDTLADFWAQLLERAFPLLHPQYSFPPDFLLCLTRLTSTADGSLQPFGDSPRRLRLQVRRSHNLSFSNL